MFFVAYCNPPNPCPVGYSEDQGCINDFENTAAFSRDYQAAQECMCDGEHMFDCPGPKDTSKASRQMNSDLESFLARQFGDKSFVAKKYQGYKVRYCGAFESFNKIKSQLLFPLQLEQTLIEIYCCN